MSYLNEYDRIPPSDSAARAALVDRWIATEPRPFFAELREKRPIFHTPACTLVTRYRDVISVLSRDDIFTVRPLCPKMEPAVGPTMLARDRQPLNWRHKSIMRSMIPMEDVPRVRQIVASIASSILEKAKLTGRIEAVDELGRAVPYRLCGDYFGFPGPDRSTMYRWSKATQTDFFMNLQDDPKIHQDAILAGQEMADHLKGLIAQRKSEESARCNTECTDVVRRLLQTHFPPGLGLDSAEVITNISVLLVGSIEPTSQAIVKILEQILLRPEVLAAALQAANESSLDAFDEIVWEALRFNPNPLLFRLTSTSAELGSGTPYVTHVSAGTLIFACTASAMWDEREVPNPDAFVPGRPSHHYLHFGYKAHECLGIHVGEVMIAETVRQVLLTKDVHLLEGAEGKIEFHGGPFPERFVLGFGGNKTM